MGRDAREVSLYGEARLSVTPWGGRLAKRNDLLPRVTRTPSSERLPRTSPGGSGASPSPTSRTWARAIEAAPA